jgi:hypothetical protein
MVQAATAAQVRMTGGGTESMRLTAMGGTGMIGDSASNSRYLIFQTGNSYFQGTGNVTVAAGKVGIGTDTPTNRLDVRSGTAQFGTAGSVMHIEKYAHQYNRLSDNSTGVSCSQVQYGASGWAYCSAGQYATTVPGVWNRYTFNIGGRAQTEYCPDGNNPNNCKYRMVGDMWCCTGSYNRPW